MVEMNVIKFNDENEKKYDALKKIGIKVTNHKYGNHKIYNISISDNPNADKFIETTFYNVNDILMAFRDKLKSNNFIVKAA